MTLNSHTSKESGRGDRQDLGALLDAIFELLDTDGNPAGSGAKLTGIYARTWQAILENLPV